MSAPDLWSVGSGGKLTADTATKAPKPAARTYDPADLAVRLAMLEDAKSAEGQAAVAGVMANRAAAAKGDLLGALTAPKAFEPWASKQEELAAIDPNSDAYKAAAAVVLPILQGKVANPVGQAINFYSPESQAALAGDGRQAKPDFDDGKGVRIGGNLFFGTGDTPAAGGDTPSSAPNLWAVGGQPQAGAADAADLTASAESPTIKVRNGKVVFGDTGQEVPAEQVKLLHSLVESGRLKDDGTIDGVMVHMQRNPSDTFAPGEFYISAPEAAQPAGPGQAAREAVGPTLRGGPQGDSFGGGLAQGVQDVGLSLVNGLSHLPGAEDSGLQNFLQSQQQVYDATHAHGMSGSGLGRFAGQVAASAPVLAAAEIPAVAGLSKLGPVGEFIAGKGVGGLATRAGSLAARNAAEGAGGAALVTSASDEPAAEQIAGGALGGAILGPALHGLVAGGKGGALNARRFLEPFTERGANKAADRTIRDVADLGGGLTAPDLTVHVPGSTPTLAEATANPALAQLQRNLRENYKVQQVFADAEGANNEARQAVTLDAQGDPATVADLARQRAAIVDAHRAHVFGGAGEADAAPVVSTIDAALASPEAAHPDVTSALTKVRGALVTEPDMAHTPEEAAAFHQAALATAGGQGAALTPEAMDAAKKALGAKFNDIAEKTSMGWDDTLRTDVGAAIHDAAQTVPESALPPLFKTLDNIVSTVKQKSEAMGLGHTEDGPATITGATYQELTRHGGPLDSLMKDNGAVGVAARKIRSALDDALERSVAAGTPEGAPTQTVRRFDGADHPVEVLDPNPVDHGGVPHVLVRGADGAEGHVPAADLHEVPGPTAVDELRTTRLQYKNLKTLEAAARTAGPDGVVTPRALYNAVRQNFGQFAYKGGGPLGDVAADAMRAIEGKTPTFEKDPAKLFAHRENLTTAIDRLAKADETDDAARAAAAKLSEVRDAMDAALDASAPGYSRYRHIADSTAEPIEAQRYLQKLPLSTNGAKGGTVTLNLVNRALDRIDTARSLPGPHPAKAITDATLTQLRALQADLEREANRDLGKAKGSPTYQLATSAVQMAGNGVPSAMVQDAAQRVPLVGRHIAGAIQQQSDAANTRVLRALASRMVNPESMPALPPAKPGSRVAGVARKVGATVPGVAGGVLGSRLFGK